MKAHTEEGNGMCLHNTHAMIDRVAHLYRRVCTPENNEKRSHKKKPKCIASKARHTHTHENINHKPLNRFFHSVWIAAAAAAAAFISLLMLLSILFGTLDSLLFVEQRLNLFRWSQRRTHKQKETHTLSGRMDQFDLFECLFFTF